MKSYAELWVCKICNQGVAQVARETSTGRLFVVCEECMNEWDDPVLAQGIGAAAFQSHGPYTLVERAEIESSLWAEFLRH